MKLHLCTENPCPLRDKECSDILKNGFKIEYIGLNDPDTHEPLYVNNQNGSKIGTFAESITN